jgi:hypothetical protein
LTRKIIRQPVPNRSASTSTPDSTGPSTAARPITGPKAANALAISSGGKQALIMASPCGIITAPNPPCSTRNAIIEAGSHASPHSSEATVNPAAPITNIRRRPIRSPRRPLTTSPTASARVYAAISHCRVEADPPISARMCGPAMVTTVASSRSITAAASTSASTCQRHR